VYDRVVTVAFERDARELPGHPRIERVVQEQVASTGETDDPCGVPRSCCCKVPSGSIRGLAATADAMKERGLRSP
jgi:hypothetical protein